MAIRFLAVRSLALLGALWLMAGVARAGPATDQTQFPSNYVPTGEQMFKQYCAACHGDDGMGRGPLTPLLKKAPPDLTTLTKRHGGKFPYKYVSNILEFGPGIAAHGSSDMPTWGPIFRYLDQHNEWAVRRRIKSLCDYLASLQRN